MNPLQALRANSRTYLVVNGGMVYQLKRIKTADLVQVGHAELNGKADVQRILKDVESAFRQGNVDESELPKKDRAKLAKNREHERKLAVETFEKLMETNPKARKAWSDRIDAFCCAGISGLGWLNPDVDAVQFSDVDRSQIGEISPVRFVREEEDEDEDAGVVWVGIIHETERIAIQSAVAKLNGVAALSRPFPGKPELSPRGG